jgi:hypothetical protein
MTGQLCACGCGKPVIPYAEGCFVRWRKAGKPASGPPAPMTAAERTARSAAGNKAARDKRVARYARLRSAGYTPKQAARRMRVTYGTALEYERRAKAAVLADGARIAAAAPAPASGCHGTPDRSPTGSETRRGQAA